MADMCFATMPWTISLCVSCGDSRSRPGVRATSMFSCLSCKTPYGRWMMTCCQSLGDHDSRHHIVRAARPPLPPCHFCITTHLDAYSTSGVCSFIYQPALFEARAAGELPSHALARLLISSPAGNGQRRDGCMRLRCMMSKFTQALQLILAPAPDATTTCLCTILSDSSHHFAG
jgi:hypothetical protein